METLCPVMTNILAPRALWGCGRHHGCLGLGQLSHCLGSEGTGSGVGLGWVLWCEPLTLRRPFVLAGHISPSESPQAVHRSLAWH